MVYVLLDGVGDLPHPDLDGKTPLEAANTPILDKIAESHKMTKPHNNQNQVGQIKDLPSSQSEALSRAKRVKRRPTNGQGNANSTLASEASEASPAREAPLCGRLGRVRGGAQGPAGRGPQRRPQYP